MSVKPPPMPDLGAMLPVVAQLESASRIEPGLARVEPGDLIRHVPGKRAIFHAALDGRAVVVRMNMTPENGATAREWAEMLRLWPHMATGDLRIPQPICACPAAGVIVQAHVPGTPLLELLYGLDPPARGSWLPPAAAWLRHSTALSAQVELAAADPWLKRAARAAATQPFEVLRGLETQILRQMQRIAPLANAQPWRTAICHGDFHPNNLIADGGRLTGVDLGGSQRLPIYKDIARFLMHMGRRRMRVPGGARFGVSATGLSAFADAFDLSAVEQGATLPFFLAFEALIRVESTALPAARIMRAEKMYRSLLGDLERVGTDTPP